MRSIHICVFGASITWGAFDGEKGGWVERLKIHFFNQKDENYASVYNLAVSGETTDDLLERMDTDCKVREPDIVVFSIGNNDSQFVKSTNSNKIDVEIFRKNLDDLCEKASKYAEKIVFVGLMEVEEEKTMPVYWNLDAFYSNENIRKYDSVIEKFCQEKNLKYISLRGTLESGDWEDGLHPNAKGHEKIYEKIKPVILNIFQEIKD